MQDTRIFVVFSQYYRSVVNQVEKVPDQQKHGTVCSKIQD